MARTDHSSWTPWIELSTFMGHVEPRSTSVYLTMTPWALAITSGVGVRGQPQVVLGAAKVGMAHVARQELPVITMSDPGGVANKCKDSPPLESG